MKRFQFRACWVGLAMLQFASQALSQANPASAMAEALQVFAAGSLRPAFTQIAKDYEAQSGQKVQLTFGASGLLPELTEAMQSSFTQTRTVAGREQKTTVRGVKLPALIEGLGLNNAGKAHWKTLLITCTAT